MTHYLNLDEDWLNNAGAIHTAREISQQPASWRKTLNQVAGLRTTVDEFIKPLLQNKHLRIVLTGAGTSAFAGKALAPWLRQLTGLRFEAVSTTDIVGAPEQYFYDQSPCLLVSFARSGNSPESVATVQIADQLLENCYHLVLTCNPQGALARQAKDNNRMLSVLMPEETNDQSLAMTSSFSSMFVAALSVFAPDQMNPQIEQAAELTENLLSEQLADISALADRGYDRLVFLGTGGMEGMAQEAALKSMELTSGKVVSLHDSPLGFRHGPKSAVNDSSVVVLMMSSELAVRRYDEDLLRELLRDNKAKEIIDLTPERLGAGDSQLHDAALSLPYLAYAQALAFYRSLSMGFTVDNPCPTGEYNRVVQGVTIYLLGS